MKKTSNLPYKKKRSVAPYDVTSPGTSQTDDLVAFLDTTGQVIKTTNVRMVNGVVIDPVEIESSQVRSLSDVTQTVPIVGGVLNINLALGNVVFFTHNSDCTLDFENIPPLGRIVYIYLVRQKDANTTDREIDWSGSTSVFNASNGIKPTLTQSSGAIDSLLLETSDGGTTFNVALKISNALTFS